MKPGSFLVLKLNFQAKIIAKWFYTWFWKQAAQGNNNNNRANKIVDEAAETESKSTWISGQHSCDFL